MAKNLILTGFMGTGKSRVGRLLSEQLGFPFVDLDRVIEERQGKNVQQIFKDYGEPFFRELEHQLCVEFSKRSSLIIATGGGTLIPKENRRLFSGDSVFCLRASFEVIKERLSRNQKRPLAQNARELWLERQPVYDQIFHQLESTNGAIEGVANRIGRLFELDQLFERPPEGFYPIHIQRGILNRLADFIDWLGLGDSSLAVVSNPKILELYKDLLPKTAELIEIPEGEPFKNLDTVRQIYIQLLDRGLTRHDTLLALGGGVVGDMTGFVAATYWRGMNYIQVPTSLLAMVDSSVGGKTGVDLPEGKNLVGAFKNPKGVLIDPELLQSLPPRELRCGLAEIVKHAIIGDPELFEYLEANCHPGLDPGSSIDLEHVIRQAINVKIKIVREDPYEQNLRMHLNLGHTFGHAIELLSDYKIPHGEAVAIGLVQAAEYALQHEKCEPQLVVRIRDLLSKLRLPVELPEGMTRKALWEAMTHDKKRKDGRLRLVLPRALGDVRVVSVQ